MFFPFSFVLVSSLNLGPDRLSDMVNIDVDRMRTVQAPNWYLQFIMTVYRPSHPDMKVRHFIQNYRCLFPDVTQKVLKSLEAFAGTRYIVTLEFEPEWFCYSSKTPVTKQAQSINHYKLPRSGAPYNNETSHFIWSWHNKNWNNTKKGDKHYQWHQRRVLCNAIL